MTDAAGYLLLTLPDCRIDSGGQIYTGQLSLECVTIAPGASNDSNERDIWLVIRLGAFEMAVPPIQPIQHDRTHGVYTIPGSPSAVVRMPVTQPNTPLREDLDTFEVLLAQYGVVHEQGGGPPAGYDDKGGNSHLLGRLVLVDETDGRIVGEVGDEYAVREDSTFNRPGHEKDPVVIDLPEYGQLQEIRVHAVPPEERDSLLRGAHALSRGIITATNLISTGLSTASNAFVSGTQPRETPVVFSERTKSNVKRVHNLSGTAVKVTAATTGVIHKAIDHVARYVAGGSTSRAASPLPGQTGPGYGYAYGTPPPLPPREKSATYAAPNTSSGPTQSSSSSIYGNSAPPYAVMPAKSATALTPLDTRVGGASSSAGYAPGAGFLSPGAISPASHAPAAGPPPLPARKPRLLNRLLMATDILLTTVEESGKHLVTVGTSSLSHSMGHRYGRDVGEAVQLGGEAVRNVGMVYIDARGVGHRALLRRAGKGMIKAKLGGNKEVVFGAGVPPPLPPR